MMREADWIVDIGPKAGRLGGKVLFSGTPADLLKTDTLTAQYLKGEKKMSKSMLILFYEGENTPLHLLKKFLR